MTNWNDLTWPEVEAAVTAQPFALLPFGAVEEHGHHMPLGTDTFVADALATRLADAAGLLQLPTMPYGQVWSLEHFDGSLSISDETVIALVLEIADGLARLGLRGLVLLSAHLGNAAALKKATRLLAEGGGLPAMTVVFPGLTEISNQVRESPVSHPGIVHADEIETSIVLAVDPGLVQMDKALREYPNYPEHFDVAAVRWHTVSESGVFGDATAATAEKGEKILDHIVATATSQIESWKLTVP